MPDTILLNGLDPLTGRPLIEPLDTAAAAAAASAARVHPAIAAMHENHASPTLGLPFGINPKLIAQSGWGLMFHSQEDPLVIAAFDPLVQLRSGQVGNPAKVKAKLVYSGEEFEDWLASHGIGPGDVKPAHVPFYLLVVGSPERIPLGFTQLLAANYALGRLHLNSAAEYQRYVQAVIDYETKPGPTNAKQAVFFGTEHIGDGATTLSCENLVKPLLDGVDGDPGPATAAGFGVTRLLAQDALKARLLASLSPPEGQLPPALVFTASHGLGWPTGDPHQEVAQGALLCGDWKGLGFSPLPIVDSQYVSAADVGQLNVRNVIAFFFACFGLATPDTDQYSFHPPDPPKQIAPKPFFSPLPKALLSAEKGPALAVIGHVERAWASSISPPGAGPQIGPFQFVLSSILAGDPIGLALMPFRDRCGTFSEMLTGLLAKKLENIAVEDGTLANTWTQQNDAGAYMLFGDPAIRLSLDKLV